MFVSGVIFDIWQAVSSNLIILQEKEVRKEYLKVKNKKRNWQDYGKKLYCSTKDGFGKIIKLFDT